MKGTVLVMAKEYATGHERKVTQEGKAKLVLTGHLDSSIFFYHKKLISHRRFLFVFKELIESEQITHRVTPTM